LPRPRKNPKGKKERGNAGPRRPGLKMNLKGGEAKGRLHCGKREREKRKEDRTNFSSSNRLERRGGEKKGTKKAFGDEAFQREEGEGGGSQVLLALKSNSGERGGEKGKGTIGGR